MSVASQAPARAAASSGTRWAQLMFGIICMVMIANLQYGWTLFVNPIDQKYHWGRAAIQVAFTHLRADRDLAGADRGLPDRQVRSARSWSASAACWSRSPGSSTPIANSLTLLYVGAAIGGVGAGIIYGASVGNALKWFPDRRGLAAGLTAAGFGAGSALTVDADRQHDRSRAAIKSAFLWFGLGQGIVVVHRRAAAARAGAGRGAVAGRPARAADPARLRPGRSAQDAGRSG